MLIITFAMSTVPVGKKIYVAYVFDFLNKWDDNVYAKYKKSTPSIRLGIEDKFSLMLELARRYPTVPTFSSLVMIDNLAFKIRLSTTTAGYIKVLGTR